MNQSSNGGEMTIGLGEDMNIFRPSPRPLGGPGVWLEGSLNGYRFQALVFAEHAEQSDWELFGDSRISKLWVRRLADKATVFNWDRGQDIPAADAEVEGVVRFLADGLAEWAYGH